jgi:hypothetical protein
MLPLPLARYSRVLRWRTLLVLLMATGSVGCTVQAGDEPLGAAHERSDSHSDGSNRSCKKDRDCPTGQYCARANDDNQGNDNHQGNEDDSGTCRPKNVDDGNPCTTDDFDSNGNPRHRPVPSGTSCSDGSACNGSEKCDASAHCLAGTPPVVDDGNPCTVDACSASAGVTHKPAANGTSCSNGNACDGAETCDSNAHCVAGAAPKVDDGNPCTTDACEAAKGVTHTPLAAGTSCANANPCDGNETCDASGACKAGAPLDSDDKNPCTVDACTPTGGVTHTPVAAGTSCADADHCNGEETCSADARCTSGTPSRVDDGNPCTMDACTASGGTTHTPLPAGTSCDDGDPCNGVSTCSAATACTPGPPPIIDDKNPCTLDQCSAANGVTHVPVPPGTSCSDGDPCNGAEVCSAGGACQPGVPLPVDDGNRCTADSCDRVLGVVHQPVAGGTSCSDGNECNGSETCDGVGVCRPGPIPSVSDANPCTTDGCDPALGVVHQPVSAGTPCSDGNACNGEETCDASGTCRPGASPPTDDGNPCTVDSCTAASGVHHEPATPGAPCGSGNACSGSAACDGQGGCVPGAAPALDDGNPCTTDTCSASGGVEHLPVAAGTSCSNGDSCDGAETCDSAGICQPGSPPTLDDGNPCTIDRCDRQQGIVHEPAAAGTSCADQNPCDGNEVCNGSGQCQSGSAPDLDDHNPCTADHCSGSGGVAHDPIPAGTSCADADHCNGEEVCSADGQCISQSPSTADDGNPCTADACSPGSGTTHTPFPAGTSCDDGDPCNGASTCNGSGACVPGAPPNVDDNNPCTVDTCTPGLGVTHLPVAGASCGDANPCNGEETCSASGACEPGAPPLVDDGNPCTADTCDATLGVRHQPIAAGASCSDGDACNGSETCNGSGGCARGPPPSLDDGNPCTADTCEAATGPRHTPLASGTACSDGNPCNGDEQCNASGACTAGTPPSTDDLNPCTLDSCDAVGGVRHDAAPAGTACPDADACNGVEQCNGSGACLPNTSFKLLTLESPVSGALTQGAATAVSGTVSASTPALVTVSPSGASVTVPGGSAPSRFSLTVPLIEGDNQLAISVTDESACTASTQVTVTRDSLPPVVTLTLPDSLTPTSPALVKVSATDAHAVSEVELQVSLGGTVLLDQFRSTPPFEFSLTAPPGAAAGDTLTLTARATDAAGNQGTATATLAVSANALVAGRVLSDATGHPVGGASVRAGEQTVTAHADGRYALAAVDSNVVVRAWQRGFTSVERATPVTFGTGSIAVDARLTPLAEPVLVSGDDVTFLTDLASFGGQPVQASVTAPVAAFDGPVAIHLTPLSPQGLPGLLPLGWSPIAAFETRLAPADTSAPETDPDAAFPPIHAPLALGLDGLPNGTLAFVRYERAAHEWRGAASLAPVSGHATTTLATLGAYAIVLADGSGAPSAAAPGAALSGLPAMDLPLDLTASGTGFPDSLPASGGHAQGRIVVPTGGSLPSGTLIGATVSEIYPLTSNLTASVDPSLQDLILYRKPIPSVPGLDPALANALGATFPIAPSYGFDAGDLAQGKIHVEILAGREAHRGKIGGHAAAEIDAAGVALAIVAGSLPADTLIDLERTTIDAFVPQTAGLTPRAELALDFAGATLGTSAVLTFTDLALDIGEVPLLAQLERIDGVAYPHVVAPGVTDGGTWTFSTGDGFPGILKDGTYLVYGTTLPLGFVTGITRAAGAPVQALVTVAGLPFVAPAALDGSYIIPAEPDTAALTARVPGTNLTAHATVAISTTHTAARDLDLTGEVTTATVAPSNGSVSVDRTTQITLTTPVALDATSVTAENIKLFLGDPSGAVLVATRLQLSASGKTLAVIPQTRLDAAQSYTLVASGLRDKVGGLVVVQVTAFKTAVEVPPVVNTDPVTVNLPADGGNATVAVPPGTFKPGTTIIITNEGNGEVVGCTVGNGGGVNCEIPATSDDTLVISVTDPDGSTTTFKRSEFHLPDGRTAIGPGGGTVTGPGGVELRIPEGALTHGVTFKINLIDASGLPPAPTVADTTTASALRVETFGNPVFQKEVHLAFPKPADAPDGSFYYVHRLLNGTANHPLAAGAAWEVIDHAFVDGTGPNAKVVTASCPFPGFIEALDAIDDGLELSGASSLLALAPGLLASAEAGLAALPSEGLGLLMTRAGFNPADAIQSAGIFLLSYSYRAIAPSEPAVGLIRGRVLQGGGAAGTPNFIKNATVFGCDADGHPFPNLPMTVATTQEDGSFTLWDEHPTQGNIIICADRDGSAGPALCPSASNQSSTVRCVTPVQNVVAACSDNVRFYRNQVKADITFPAPPGSQAAPPPIDIAVMRAPDGKRELTDGITVVGDPLIFGFRAATYIVNQAQIKHNGTAQSANPYDDPQFGQTLGWNQIANFTPDDAGAYTITASAVPEMGGPSVSAQLTFSVVAPGGDVKKPIPGPPGVIDGRTVPKRNAEGVPTEVFPQVTFTEPVTNLTNNVQLVEVIHDPNPLIGDHDGPPLEVKLVGVQTNDVPVELHSTATAVTALTVQPILGLKYDTQYKLTVGGSISDQDDQLPPGGGGTTTNAFSSPYQTAFRTVKPQFVGSTGDSFSSAGIAVVGDQAFVVQNDYTTGLLRTYDISDPSSPTEFPEAQRQLLGRPMDVVATSDGQDGFNVVMVTGPANVSLPSNLREYHVHQTNTGWQSDWIAGSTLSATAVEGIVRRVAVSGGFAYALTTQKGLQIVDLRFAEQVFQDGGGDTSRIRVPFNTDGEGFGQEAVTSTIPILVGSHAAFLSDLRIVDTSHGFAQPLIAVTGEVPLLLMDPLTSEILYQDTSGMGGTGFRGRAIELVHRDDGDYAFIAGDAGNVSKLIVVDISNPRQPKSQKTPGTPPPGFCSGPSCGDPVEVIIDRPTDICVKDKLVLVGGDTATQIVNVGRATTPFVAGSIDQIGGRVIVDDAGIVIATTPSTLGGDVPGQGGVRTVTLGLLPLIVATDSPLSEQSEEGAVTSIESKGPIGLQLRAYAPSGVTSGTLELTEEDPQTVSTSSARPIATLVSGSSFAATPPTATAVGTTFDVPLIPDANGRLVPQPNTSIPVVLKTSRGSYQVIATTAESSVDGSSNIIIPPGISVPPNAKLRAVFRFFSDGALHESLPKRIAFRTLQIQDSGKPIPVPLVADPNEMWALHAKLLPEARTSGTVDFHWDVSGAGASLQPASSPDFNVQFLEGNQPHDETLKVLAQDSRGFQTGWISIPVRVRQPSGTFWAIQGYPRGDCDPSAAGAAGCFAQVETQLQDAAKSFIDALAVGGMTHPRPHDRAVDFVKSDGTGVYSTTVTVAVFSTCRSPQWAYLHHYAWTIFKGGDTNCQDPIPAPNVSGPCKEWPVIRRLDTWAAHHPTHESDTGIETYPPALPSKIGCSDDNAASDYGKGEIAWVHWKPAGTTDAGTYDPVGTEKGVKDMMAGLDQTSLHVPSLPILDTHVAGRAADISFSWSGGPLVVNDPRSTATTPLPPFPHPSTSGPLTSGTNADLAAAACTYGLTWLGLSDRNHWYDQNGRACDMPPESP